MARIEGVDLPRDKRVEIGLTYIYGVGLKHRTDILAAANISPDTACQGSDRCRSCRRCANTSSTS